MQLMKPIDPRWDIRVLLNEGDTRPGSSSLPAILARFFKQTDPGLAGELMQVWIEGGRDLSGGMGIPERRAEKAGMIRKIGSYGGGWR